VPERCEVWYSDGRTGFYNVRLTNGTCDVMRGGGGVDRAAATEPTQPAKSDTADAPAPKPSVPAPAPSSAGDKTVDPAPDRSRICVLSVCL
jgi:hypothetical protein